jgi:hypothetical protein
VTAQEPLYWQGKCPDCKYKGTFGLAEVDAERIPVVCPGCGSEDWSGALVYPPKEEDVTPLGRK